VDLATAVPELLGKHSLVEGVQLTGSRASGTTHDLSDWDFLVHTSDFSRLADELPDLAEPLRPIAAQWDRYSDHACYMLMLRGPTKVDLIFPDERQSWADAWQPSAATLTAIDAHFWDWILWLEQKRRGGKDEALTTSLADMHRLMLAPMGARSSPRSVFDAVRLFLELRTQLENRYGVEVPRELEREVRPSLGARRIEKGSD
jgi:hypothetical protein